MCDKCFRRSAIILAALVGGVAIPPEHERDEHPNDRIRWTPSTVDAFKAIVMQISRYGDIEVPEGQQLLDIAPEDPLVEGIDRDIETVLKGMTAHEVTALATLCDGLGRHIKAIKGWSEEHVATRAIEGDKDAIEIVSARAGEMLQGTIAQLITQLSKGGSPFASTPKAGVPMS